MSDIIERLRPHSQIIMVSPEFCNEVIDEIDRLTAERDRALDRIAAMEGLREQEPMVTKRKSGLILHAGWDPLPVGAKLYAAPMPPSIDAHELWAAAQLTPGEGIKDGVDRIAALLASAPKPEDV